MFEYTMDEILEVAEKNRKMTENIVNLVLSDYDAFVQCNLILRNGVVKLQTIAGIRPQGDTRDITIVTVSNIPLDPDESLEIGKTILRRYLSDLRGEN